MKKTEFQSGTSLYLAVIIMVIILAVALGLTAILVSQLKMVKETGYSVIAFYAADAGIEKFLKECYMSVPVDLSGSLSNGAQYQVSFLLNGAGGCVADNYCVKSIGTYQGVSRAIEITY